MIGGNTTAILQVQTTTVNEIGERVPAWVDVWEHTGFLDFQAGEAKHTSYNAKIQESTHVFICDYKPIPETFEIDGEIIKVDSETCRMVAKSQRYDVILIDDPMELHKHLEIYLKFTGGQ